jgi:hypothetical protein
LAHAVSLHFLDFGGIDGPPAPTILAAAAHFQILLRARPWSYLASDRYDLLIRPDLKFFGYPLPLCDDAVFRVAEICRDFPVCFPGGKPSQKQFFSGAHTWEAIHFDSPVARNSAPAAVDEPGFYTLGHCPVRPGI